MIFAAKNENSWNGADEGSIPPTFYAQLLRTQVSRTAFCAYISGLYLTGTRLLAQKLRVER
jgi:hypothetical protein